MGPVSTPEPETPEPTPFSDPWRPLGQ
jgi:hypothetical protein